MRCVAAVVGVDRLFAVQWAHGGGVVRWILGWLTDSTAL